MVLRLWLRLLGGDQVEVPHFQFSIESSAYQQKSTIGYISRWVLQQRRVYPRGIIIRKLIGSLILIIAHLEDCQAGDTILIVESLEKLTGRPPYFDASII